MLCPRFCAAGLSSNALPDTLFVQRLRHGQILLARSEGTLGVLRPDGRSPRLPSSALRAFATHASTIAQKAYRLA